MFTTGEYLNEGYLSCVKDYTPPITDGELIISNDIKNVIVISNHFTKVVMPDSVIYIESGLFDGHEILVEVSLPNTITEIAGYLFYGCISLSNIVIPQSVTEIGDWAFYECSSLTSITIPSGVKSIHDYAFGDCTALDTITFEGTTNEWSSISLGYYWNDNVPATQVVCSDGTITL